MGSSARIAHHPLGNFIVVGKHGVITSAGAHVTTIIPCAGARVRALVRIIITGGGARIRPIPIIPGGGAWLLIICTIIVIITCLSELIV